VRQISYLSIVVCVAIGKSALSRASVLTHKDVAALSNARHKPEPRARDIRRGEGVAVGSAGVLPVDMDTKALMAEQLTAKHLNLPLSQDEQEGAFFAIGATILGVYGKASVSGAGIRAAAVHFGRGPDGLSRSKNHP
jgi:hypothetical protein